DVRLHKPVSSIKEKKMASYVESALTKGEQVVYQGKVSIWSLMPLLLLGLVFLFFYGLGLLFWVAAAIRYFTTELAITNKRVIAKFGFISRSTIEINLQKIESIQVNQGILGRIFNFGSIVVSGAGNPQAPIPGISNPLQFRRAFIDTQESNGQPHIATQPA
ncbi:MAG: PH domain-containing protein, partial [Rhodocyclaceae bacterium]